ncbi:hypothetical protein GCM10009612_24680 [Streptomyces beijiangensis]
MILQEYLPREDAEDWIVHAYFGSEAEPLALFTGVKVRSWPPHAGMTALAYVVDNPELSALAAQFIKQIGFSGVVDLDLRFDRRDGQYKLLDFNPRMGGAVPPLRERGGGGCRTGPASASDRTQGARVGAAGGAPLSRREHRPARAGRVPAQRIQHPARAGTGERDGARVVRDGRRPAADHHGGATRRAGPGFKHLYQLWRSTTRRGATVK